jgi:hypothetical protein
VTPLLFTPLDNSSFCNGFAHFGHDQIKIGHDNVLRPTKIGFLAPTANFLHKKIIANLPIVSKTDFVRELYKSAATSRAD